LKNIYKYHKKWSKSAIEVEATRASRRPSGHKDRQIRTLIGLTAVGWGPVGGAVAAGIQDGFNKSDIGAHRPIEILAGFGVGLGVTAATALIRLRRH
jgi:hypothetical protein